MRGLSSSLRYTFEFECFSHSELIDESGPEGSYWYLGARYWWLQSLCLRDHHIIYRVHCAWLTKNSLQEMLVPELIFVSSEKFSGCTLE